MLEVRSKLVKGTSFDPIVPRFVDVSNEEPRPTKEIGE
jgi:hypothetical protein